MRGNSLIDGVFGAGGADFSGDDDGDDEAIDGDDTGHDDGNDRLHDEVGSGHRHRRDSRPRLRRAVSGARR